MSAAGRKRERSSRRHAVQVPLWVEGVEERVEVVLVRAATVEEDERSLRLARRRTLENMEIAGRGVAPLGIFAR